MSVINNIADTQMPESQDVNKTVQQSMMMHVNQKENTIKNKG